jgi:Nucleoside-diphosphate-sugar epimerases
LMLEGNKELLRKVNVDGAKNLLDVAGGAAGDWGGKCKAFVYTSSSSVVHDTKSDLINVNEEWPYIRGKLQVEYYSETKVGSYPSINVERNAKTVEADYLLCRRTQRR